MLLQLAKSAEVCSGLLVQIVTLLSQCEDWYNGTGVSRNRKPVLAPQLEPVLAPQPGLVQEPGPEPEAAIRRLRSHQHPGQTSVSAGSKQTINVQLATEAAFDDWVATNMPELTTDTVAVFYDEVKNRCLVNIIPISKGTCFYKCMVLMNKGELGRWRTKHSLDGGEFEAETFNLTNGISMVSKSFVSMEMPDVWYLINHGCGWFANFNTSYVYVHLTIANGASTMIPFRKLMANRDLVSFEEIVYSYAQNAGKSCYLYTPGEERLQIRPSPGVLAQRKIQFDQRLTSVNQRIGDFQLDASARCPLKNANGSVCLHEEATAALVPVKCSKCKRQYCPLCQVACGVNTLHPLSCADYLMRAPPHVSEDADVYSGYPQLMRDDIGSILGSATLHQQELVLAQWYARIRSAARTHEQLQSQTCVLQEKETELQQDLVDMQTELDRCKAFINSYPTKTRKIESELQAAKANSGRILQTCEAAAEEIAACKTGSEDQHGVLEAEYAVDLIVVQAFSDHEFQHCYISITTLEEQCLYHLDEQGMQVAGVELLSYTRPISEPLRAVPDLVHNFRHGPQTDVSTIYLVGVYECFEFVETAMGFLSNSEFRLQDSMERYLALQPGVSAALRRGLHGPPGTSFVDPRHTIRKVAASIV